MSRSLKEYVPALLAVVLGAAGACFRAAELQYGIVGRIYDKGFYSTAIPVIIGAIFIFAAFFAWRSRVKPQPEYSSLLQCSKRGFAGILIAALVLVAAGSMQVVQYAQTQVFSELIYGLLTVFAGVSLALMGAVFAGRPESELFGVLASVPVFWGCFLLILTFLEHPAEPVIPVFACDLLACCACVITLYAISAAIIKRKRSNLAIFGSFSATALILMALGGRVLYVLRTKDLSWVMDAPFRLAAFTAMLLYFLVIQHNILKNLENDHEESNQSGSV